MALSSIPLIAWLLAAPVATQVVAGILGAAIAAAALFGLGVALYKTVQYVHNRSFKKEEAVVVEGSANPTVGSTASVSQVKPAPPPAHLQRH